MSLPSTAFGSGRRLRAPSVGSHSSPRIIPGSSDQDSNSIAPSDANYGSFRGNQEIQGSVPNTSTNHREPTRSSVHLSYRGPQAAIDSAQYARSVREDTADLASFALSDRASAHSTSPPRRSSHQTHLESFFASGPDAESATNRESEPLHQTTIHEVSEPGSPEGSARSDKSPGTSVLTNMLRRSPPSTSPPQKQQTREEAVEDDIEPEAGSYRGRKIVPQAVQEDEQTPLLGKGPVEHHHHPDWIQGEQDLEGQKAKGSKSWPKIRNAALWPKEKGLHIVRDVLNPKTWDRKVIWQNAVVAPVSYLPAVIIGLILNVLDALSYGMILFPLGQPTFQTLGSAGISMFYVSCIVSQLVFSLGGSGFKGGIGSEMIEVVPFFHKMAFKIIEKVGEENTDAVIATTITSYAISSVITGLVFFGIGSARLGYMVGFIPRNILIGCIGGVGFFLVVTGFEVSARLDGNLNYDGATLRKMFELDTFQLWIIPFVLAIVLFRLGKKINSKYLLPGFILTIPAIFYFFVLSLDELDLGNLTRNGWIFEGPESGEPWWYFYTLYNFRIVHWGAIAECIPSMLALTFFGVLHVPINVPSLAFSVGDDNISLDKELIAHGVSNALSGIAGSIQNYLVYANSQLFYKSGGDSRVAGFMLAVGTFGVMLAGPGIIGYIPIMMVGCLIFLLGFELLIEALWLPRKKLHLYEYLTVVAIVLVMGIYDFVVGIFLGVGLAFVSFVILQSRVEAVRGDYSGEVVSSTVRRSPTQSRYLRKVGEQIHVTKLSGYLFFGSIVNVEDRIVALIGDEAFRARPIRFLVLDLRHVTGLDYSAAEAFNRLNRIFSKKGVSLVMSGVQPNGPFNSTLLAVGLGQGEGDNEVKMLSDLNSALESCENELLKTLYTSKDARSTHHSPAHLDLAARNQLATMANTTLDESPAESKYQNFKEPLRLILQTFHGLTTKNEDFWFRAVPYFTKKEYPAGTALYNCGELAQEFYLLEDGILRADYDLPQGQYFESIVAGTTCGELPFFSETVRTATVAAERDCVTWLLTRESWENLEKSDPDVANELLRIAMKLTSERMDAITAYVLTTAG
ncbi:Uncharacterized protein LSUE1_G003124 [Lachnellula suecica]|uniref:Sulfate transporter n=1 Tax=Lachnellula suecica TaxID=602035 RepID=A0A8T9CCA3_9HELO|nr:Uncharacterized protein LSUE1_G003124 [Lachnellula suecica]